MAPETRSGTNLMAAGDGPIPSSENELSTALVEVEDYPEYQVLGNVLNLRRALNVWQQCAAARRLESEHRLTAERSRSPDTSRAQRL